MGGLVVRPGPKVSPLEYVESLEFLPSESGTSDLLVGRFHRCFGEWWVVGVFSFCTVRGEDVRGEIRAVVVDMLVQGGSAVVDGVSDGVDDGLGFRESSGEVVF